MHSQSRKITTSTRDSALTHVGSILRDHLVEARTIEERSALSGGRRYHVGERGSIPRYSCGQESTGHPGLVPATIVARIAAVARGLEKEERDGTAKGGDEGGHALTYPCRGSLGPRV